MTLPWLRFEPPSVRQARLRETTMRLSGEVLDLTEQRENLLRFREIDRQVPTFDIRQGMAAAQAAGKRRFPIEGGETVIPGG